MKSGRFMLIVITLLVMMGLSAVDFSELTEPVSVYAAEAETKIVSMEVAGIESDLYMTDIILAPPELTAVSILVIGIILSAMVSLIVTKTKPYKLKGIFPGETLAFVGNLKQSFTY